MWYRLKIRKPQEQPDLHFSFFLPKERLQEIVNAAIDFISAAYESPVYLILENDTSDNTQEYLITPNRSEVISDYVKVSCKLRSFSLDISDQHVNDCMKFKLEKIDFGGETVFDFQDDFCSVFDFLSHIDENFISCMDEIGWSPKSLRRTFSLHVMCAKYKRFPKVRLVFSGQDLKVIPFIVDFCVKVAKALQTEEVYLNIEISWWVGEAYDMGYAANADVRFGFDLLF